MLCRKAIPRGAKITTPSDKVLENSGCLSCQTNTMEIYGCLEARLAW